MFRPMMPYMWATMQSLFDPDGGMEALGPGAAMLHGHALADGEALLQAIDAVAADAPVRHMVTPGGFEMSVAMTNCGAGGWITDRKGYRYTREDPDTGRAWPAMPPLFLALARTAADAAGFPGFVPDACLINRY